MSERTLWRKTEKMENVNKNKKLPAPFKGTGSYYKKLLNNLAREPDKKLFD